MRHRRLEARITLMACALSAVMAGGCAVNPATGEQQLSLISEPQEIQMGRSSAAEVARSIGLVEDPELQRYVSGIGTRLAAKSERPDLPWAFQVVDDPTPNAFALPGGFIFVTRGMMNLMTSEAELATVLGHEIGHVTARHSVSQLSRAQLAQLGLGLGMVLMPELQSVGGLANTGLELMFLKYGRDAERQADELGFRYAYGQNYDVKEMAAVFRALKRSSALAGVSALPGWLATHPAEAERIASAEARVRALGTPQQNARVGRDEYLGQIDGLVYGQNPRLGFFRGRTFYHPDLRFQFTLPDGWKGQNLTTAVVGVSPKNDGAVQLTLAGDMSPSQAASRFAEQQGVQTGASDQHRFNGVPAVVSSFQAQSGQTVVQGYAAFLSHGGHTFQLVAYAPQAAFASHQRDFEQVISSFAPLTDRSALEIQPQHIDIVRLDRGMSLTEFARRQNSPIPLDQLGLINQIENPNALIAAGTSLKRVTGKAFKSGA